MSSELKGKAAIVTGGANGIGRGAVERFVEAGACVVIADMNAEAGESLALSLGDAAIFRHTDVSQSNEVSALVDMAASTFGRLDVMFNNAGISGAAHRRLVDDDLADFDNVIKTNLLGVMLGTRFAARQMSKQGGGSIINTASIGGSFPGYGLTTYRAAKAGVLFYTKSAAIDLAEENIRVNSISPGHVATDITTFSTEAGYSRETMARLQEALTDAQSENQPLKRCGTVADTAEAALYLASDRSVYVTGIDIPIDGGTSLGDPVNQLDRMLAARASVLGASD